MDVLLLAVQERVPKQVNVPVIAGEQEEKRVESRKSSLLERANFKLWIEMIHVVVVTFQMIHVVAVTFQMCTQQYDFLVLQAPN